MNCLFVLGTQINSAMVCGVLLVFWRLLKEIDFAEIIRESAMQDRCCDKCAVFLVGGCCILLLLL